MKVHGNITQLKAFESKFYSAHMLIQKYELTRNRSFDLNIYVYAIFTSSYAFVSDTFSLVIHLNIYELTLHQ